MSPFLQTHSRAVLQDRTEVLNHAFDGSSAQDVLSYAVEKAFPGHIALVSSFGAESAVLLHMLAQISSDVPIVFLNTDKHFSETLDYVKDLCGALGLTNLKEVEPNPAHLEADDPDGTLHKRDTDRCCYIRKTLPMIKALNPYRSWITGRKRFQAASRSDIEFFEVQDNWIKVNPLAHWGSVEIQDYRDTYNLPPHPLVAQGYPSIGCAPCTSKVEEGEDPRAGRWKDSDKTECGIHITEDGKVIRLSQSQSE